MLQEYIASQSDVTFAGMPELGHMCCAYPNFVRSFDPILTRGYDLPTTLPLAPQPPPPPSTVLHRFICDVFWGLGDRSYTIIVHYGYQMKS